MPAAQALGEEQPDTPSVADYLGQWLSHTRGRVRPTTYEGYEAIVRRHLVPRIGHLSLDGIRPLDLQGLYSELLAEGQLRSGTVLNLHLVLTQALGQAVRWGLIPANPAAGTIPPRPRRAEPALVNAEVAQRILRATLGTSFELPVAIALCTGMRRGETLGLRWSDLDRGLTSAQVRRTLQPTAQGLVIQEPKTRRSRRQVALPATLRPHLVRARADQRRRRAALGDAWSALDLVVDRGDGGYLHPGTLSSGWSTFVRRTGLPKVRFHDLRHAHATLMLLQGVHPKIVSERLGHASIGITLDLYSHVLPSMQTEAARVFDELFAIT